MTGDREARRFRNAQLSERSLARRSQTRLTHTRSFLPAAAAARDKLKTEGEKKQNSVIRVRTHLSSAGLLCGPPRPAGPLKLPESHGEVRQRRATLHDPDREPHNRSDRETPPRPAPFRAAPGSDSLGQRVFMKASEHMGENRLSIGRH